MPLLQAPVFYEREVQPNCGTKTFWRSNDICPDTFSHVKPRNAECAQLSFDAAVAMQMTAPFKPLPFDGKRLTASQAAQAEVSHANNEVFGKEEIGLRVCAMRVRESPRHSVTIRDGLAVSAAVILCCLLTSCTISSRVTPDSGLGQQLLFYSLERSVAGLDSSRFTASKVSVDLFTLSDERTKSFVKEFLIARLKERGFNIVRDGEEVDLRFAVFLSVFGLDEDETLVGLPAFVAPLMGVAVPEIAPYKSARSRSTAAVQLYAFDGQTGEFVGKTPVSVGHARYDQYKALIFANFTVSDIPLEAGQRFSLDRDMSVRYTQPPLSNTPPENPQ